MEEEFVVKSHSEGTVPVTADITRILSTMGCLGFNERNLGSVKAVVEKVDGKITKQKLVWAEDNDPKFNESQLRNANELLSAAIKAVEGAGDPSDIYVKFVTKK